MERMQKTVDVEGVQGTLTHFLIEPFMKHDQADELLQLPRLCLQDVVRPEDFQRGDE